MIALSQVRNCGAVRGSAVCVLLLLGRLVMAEGLLEVAGSPDNLSIRASAVTLRDVLQVLNDRDFISVESTASLDEEVSLEHKDVAVDHLVRQLLRQYSYLMVAVPGSPVRLEITAPGQHETVAYWQTRESTSFDSAIAELSSPDPDEREEAILTLSDLGHRGAIPYLQSMLNDANPHVREAAQATLEDFNPQDDST